MHDVSIKLLAVVEGPREVEDEDDGDVSRHCRRGNDRIRCMMELNCWRGQTCQKKRQKTK